MSIYHYYRLHFDETPNVLRPEDNLYDFDLKFDHEAQKGELRIPDCGGMMDTEPKSPKQEAWVLALFNTLPHKRVWNTIWEFYDEPTHRLIIESLESAGAQLIRIDQNSGW